MHHTPDPASAALLLAAPSRRRIRSAARALVPVSRIAFAALMLALAAAPFASASQGDATSFIDSLAKGKFSGAARYRYEIYDQDSVPGATTVGGGLITDTAIASSMRLALAYESALYNGFNLVVESEGIYAIGEKHSYRIPNHPEQGNVARAIIADPNITGLNQAFVRWKTPDNSLQFLAGREAYAINNGRFISVSGWRQNNQGIDLARATYRSGAIAVNYGYLARVYRVVGSDAFDGDLGMSSHVATLDYAKSGVGSASLYTLLLDYDDAAQSGNDTQSIGLRLSGPYKLNDDWNLVYTADYAHQSDYADNALNVSLDYWCFELGAAYKTQRVFAGWTVLEGGNGATFRTPLAHPFNGWTEKFLNTPGNGLEALYLTATGLVPGVKGLSYTVTYYDYHATTGSAHYGSELDAALEWKAEPIHQNLTVGWRFGNYFADELFTDSLRTSVYAAFKF